MRGTLNDIQTFITHLVTDRDSDTAIQDNTTNTMLENEQYLCNQIPDYKKEQKQRIMNKQNCFVFNHYMLRTEGQIHLLQHWNSKWLCTTIFLDAIHWS